MVILGSLTLLPLAGGGTMPHSPVESAEGGAAKPQFHRAAATRPGGLGGFVPPTNVAAGLPSRDVAAELALPKGLGKATREGKASFAATSGGGRESAERIKWQKIKS